MTPSTPLQWAFFIHLLSRTWITGTKNSEQLKAIWETISSSLRSTHETSLHGQDPALLDWKQLLPSNPLIPRPSQTFF